MHVDETKSPRPTVSTAFGEGSGSGGAAEPKAGASKVTMISQEVYSAQTAVVDSALAAFMEAHAEFLAAEKAESDSADSSNDGTKTALTRKTTALAAAVTTFASATNADSAVGQAGLKVVEADAPHAWKLEPLNGKFELPTGGLNLGDAYDNEDKDDTTGDTAADRAVAAVAYLVEQNAIEAQRSFGSQCAIM